MSAEDNYPPGFDQRLLDDDDTEEREAKIRREEDDANFRGQDIPDTEF